MDKLSSLPHFSGTPEKKAYRLKMIFPPKQTLRLIQGSIAVVNLMNAMFAKACAVAVAIWR
jgi:hypothetical protein